MRCRLFEIIEPAKNDDRLSFAYDIFMVAMVILSLLPLAFKDRPSCFAITDLMVSIIFIIDYILRIFTADIKLRKKFFPAFIQYPFTLPAIIDLLSILPILSLLADYFRLFRIFRMVKALRLFRIFGLFKAFRYSRTVQIIYAVVKDSKEALVIVAGFACFYILISALLVFNVEPETFSTFFDAIYWATVSLTTVGYGDLYPMTTIGKMVSMVSSFFGIAIIALPASIITAGYMKELNHYMDEKHSRKDGE
ncbi:potassium channel family protein [Fibrobacter sp.]